MTWMNKRLPRGTRRAGQSGANSIVIPTAMTSNSVATIVFADPQNLRVNEVGGVNGLNRVGVAQGVFDVSPPNPDLRK